jgi:hypothetical protein
MAANTQVITLGLLLALSYVPQNLQIVIVLVAASVFISFIVGTKGKDASDTVISRMREHGSTEMVKHAPSRAADRFDDAKAALGHLKVALEQFDPHRVEQIACSMDDCIEEYLDVLAGEPGARADAHLVAHMLTREEIQSLLIEANITCDGSAKVTSRLDQAAERIAALFQSFDRVLHVGGYTSRPGPVPSLS